MPVFHSEQWIDANLDRVFAFFSDPNNLPRLMPEASRPRIVRLEIIPPAAPGGAGLVAGPGSEIEVSFRILLFLPIRGTWLARIIEFEANVHFTDIQVRGPFKSWRHRHEFFAEERNGHEGTIIHDVVEYEVGYGWLGILAEPLARWQITKMFAQRRRRGEELLGNQ